MNTIFRQLILLFALIPICNNAQNSIESNLSSNEIKSMNLSVQLYWDWKTDQDPINAIAQLEEITAKNNDNWIAPYWASYISTQVANAAKDNKESNLQKAQSFFDEAKTRFSKNADVDNKEKLSNFYGLQSLIYRLKGFYYASQDQKETAKDYLNKSISELGLGIKNNPENPILMVMAATGLAIDANKNFGDIIAAVALLEKAKVEFAKIKERSAIDISYWNEHWIDPWLKNLKPSKQ